MRSMEEDCDVGLEEGRVWLPSHILDETSESKGYLQSQQHHHHHKPSMAAEPSPQRSFSSQRAKILTRQASVLGPGMQAVFLDSSQRSSGTGFFLPKIGGSNFQPSNKPACSPVLLPLRVVQALNLDVHALGTQLTPRRDPNNNKRGGHRNSINDRSGSNVGSQAPKYSSPEIFLPKEWSY